jgi:hypothetical protein
MHKLLGCDFLLGCLEEGKSPLFPLGPGKVLPLGTCQLLACGIERADQCAHSGA